MRKKIQIGTRVVEANSFGYYGVYILLGKSHTGKTVNIKFGDGVQRKVHPSRLRVVDDESKLQKLQDNNDQREKLRLENIKIYQSMPEIDLEELEEKHNHI
jgi:hypothetical protein